MYGLKQIIDMYKKHDFEIFVVLSILFIVALIFYNKIKGYTGSRNKLNMSDVYNTVFRNSSISSRPTVNRRGPPQESKGEKECRRVMEKIFKKPFPKIRPNFLRNTVTSGEENGDINLEIDCYNNDLKIGVEYSGIQHYKYSPFFHKNKEAFYNQKYRDEMKRVKCRENGITLIEVPYTVKLEHIEDYLRARINRAIN
jgi:hypothetical protein